MSDHDLSTCTCIDCDPVRWLPEPPPEWEPTDWRDDDWPDDDDLPDEAPDFSCPHRFTDDGSFDCWSGNCRLAAQELLEAVTGSPWHRWWVHTEPWFR